MGVWNWELAFFDLGMWNEMRRYVEALLLFSLLIFVKIQGFDVLFVNYDSIKQSKRS